MLEMIVQIKQISLDQIDQFRLVRLGLDYMCYSREVDVRNDTIFRLDRLVQIRQISLDYLDQFRLHVLQQGR